MRTSQLLRIAFFSLLLALGVSAQDPKQTPTPTPTPRVVGEVTVTDTKANTDQVYQKFRNLSDASNSFGGEYATVNNLILKKDEGIFTLKSGEIYFITPAEGRVTGAVFIGDGEFALAPPIESEKRMLNFFIEKTEVKEEFTQLVMFFTDKTYEAVKNSPNAKLSTNGPQAGKARDAFRDKETIMKEGNDSVVRTNITTRILMDAYAPARSGFFRCFIDGKKYEKLMFVLDPLGIEDISPEQVMLYNYSLTGRGVWVALHLASEYAKGTATSSADRRVFDIKHHEMDVTIRGTRIFATDIVTMATRVKGQRVLPFDNYKGVKFKRVTDEAGNELSIVQESRREDAELAIILPETPEVGKDFKLTFEYESGDVIRQEGPGNFALSWQARSNWYPNNGGTQFGDRARFDIIFRYAKQMSLIGVGEQVEPERIEGEFKVAKWSSKDLDLAVAGFNYGDFVKKEIADPVAKYTLEVYVNKELPDDLKEIQKSVEFAEARAGGGINITATTGSLNTVGMANTVLGETQNATRIYNEFFGRLPYKRIAMSQQPEDNFGQAWPTLIYMPSSAFISETQRVQIYGIRRATGRFQQDVGAHEISHQWWGHLVGWSSYHDQWMSEGFSQFATSLYIQYAKKDIKGFNGFWDDQRRLIVQGNALTKGIKPYTVGPVTQGYRLSTGKAGPVTLFLIYPKGAYILHMIRMLMFDKKDGDAKLRAMLKDFIATHYNKDVSTEDFKRIVEKHMTPEMDVDKNGKMDWFFDQWVYGTEVPAYKFEYNLADAGDKTILNATLTQSDVSKNFVQPVPIYVDFGKGELQLLGRVNVVGSSSFELKDIQLPKGVKKVTICALSDVLNTKIDVVKR